MISEGKYKLIQLRELVWLQDIESSANPEYIEHHESIQRILKYIDVMLKDEI
jgi:hypothetical protein